MNGELFIVCLPGSSPPRWGFCLTHRTGNGVGMFIADGCPRDDAEPMEFRTIGHIATTSKPGQILELFGDLSSDTSDNRKFVAEALRKLREAGHILDDVCQKWTLRLTARLRPLHLSGINPSPADLHTACLTRADLSTLQRVQSQLYAAGLTIQDLTAVGLSVGGVQIHAEETGMSLADLSVNWVPTEDQSAGPSILAFRQKLMPGPRLANAIRALVSRRNAPASIASTSDISAYLTSFRPAPAEISTTRHYIGVPSSQPSSQPSAFSPVVAHSFINSPTIGPSATRLLNSPHIASPLAPHPPAHPPANSPTHPSVIRPVPLRPSPPGPSPLPARDPRSEAGPSGIASAALLARDPHSSAAHSPREPRSAAVPPGTASAALLARDPRLVGAGSPGAPRLAAVPPGIASATLLARHPHSAAAHSPREPRSAAVPSEVAPAAYSSREPRLAAVSSEAGLTARPFKRHRSTADPSEHSSREPPSAAVPSDVAPAGASSPRDRDFTVVSSEATLRAGSPKKPHSAAIPSDVAPAAHLSSYRHHSTAHSSKDRRHPAAHSSRDGRHSAASPSEGAGPSEAALIERSSRDHHSKAGKDAVVHSSQKSKKATEKSREGSPARAINLLRDSRLAEDPTATAIDLLGDPRLTEDSTRAAPSTATHQAQTTGTHGGARNTQHARKSREKDPAYTPKGRQRRPHEYW